MLFSQFPSFYSANAGWFRFTFVVRWRARVQAWRGPGWGSAGPARAARAAGARAARPTGPTPPARSGAG